MTWTTYLTDIPVKITQQLIGLEGVYLTGHFRAPAAVLAFFETHRSVKKA